MTVKLIAEIAVQGFRTMRQSDDGIALRIGGYVAVVDVHHVGDCEGVVEILVGGVERGHRSLKRTPAFGEIAVDVHIPVEPPA